jgi:hypothetical protein
LIDPDRLNHLRRALLALSALAALWAAVVWITGGFVAYVGSLPITSRNPRNPALIALLSALAARALPRPGGRRTFAQEWRWWTARIAAQRKRWPRVQWIDPALLIALVGIALTIDQWAGAPPLWLDEEMIALNVRDRSFVGLAGPLWLGQSAPFGWLVLERAAMLTLGVSERAVRLVPVLFGIATLVSAVWVGRRWMNPIGAGVFVLLCTFGRWTSHYPLEVKHYSADVFFGLLLPALAVWTTEADTTRQMRRAAIWWAIAGVGLWLANGALLVTPACAVILLVIIWRRRGWRAGAVFSLLGCVWFASFILHFLVAIRHAMDNEFLRSYWASGLPPAGAGSSEMLHWLASRFEALAINPAGTDTWVRFWLAAAGGFALAAHRFPTLIFAAIPFSAFVFAVLQLVPLHERLSLWTVPALYFGVALCVDSAVRLGRDAFHRRSWTLVAFTGVLAVIALPLCANIFWRGKEDFRIGRPRDQKQRLDDRAAIEWLMQQRRHGDVLITTHLALPALWWYGGVALSNPQSPGSRLSDGIPIMEIGYATPGSGCQANELRDVLHGQRRALVYVGFPDVPDGFDELLLRRLRELGTIVSARRFADIGRAAVIDLEARPDAHSRSMSDPPVRDRATPVQLDGCVVARPAARW